MALLDWFKKRKSTKAIRITHKLIREIQLQGSTPEGARSNLIIESMLSGARLNISIPGVSNAFQSYDSQTREMYRKYNGLTDFGNQQVRAIVDLRTAFIAGEGISVTCEDENTAEWINDLLKKNRMNGSQFTNSVKGSELSGQSLFVLTPKRWKDDSVFVKLLRIPYLLTNPFKPVFRDNSLRDEVIGIQVKRNGQWEALTLTNFQYIRTGGDDASSEGPVTRTGTVLTDIENYDRAIRDMRRNNHIFARITPTIKTESDSETKALQSQLDQQRWKIGDMFIGKALFGYETPGTGAYDNLNTELVATIKTISSVTGVPVHWLGYVDLMSNRATAQTLYELIKQATILERQIWEESLYEMIFQAQEIFIDSGGEGLNRLDPAFQVRLPLIDFAEFLNRVKGLSLAFGDGAISMGDYRNMLPGINPYETEKMIDEEKAKDEQSLKTNTIIPFTEEGEEDGQEQSNNGA
jgi:hypothetical protein